MIEFKTLKIEDRDVFIKYLGNYTFETYEYSFLTLYLWKEYCSVEYGFLKDALIIKKSEENKGSYFMQPIGFLEKNLPEIISVLMQIRKKDPNFKSLLRDLEEPFLNLLKKKYGTKVLYYEDEGNFDYLYSTKKLIDLTGQKLHKKRNQYNQFVNTYNYKIRDISDDGVREDCLNFSVSWLEEQKVKHKEIIFELEGIRDILNYPGVLKALGMAVYVNDKIAGFTVGEKVNRQMAVIHVEKGDTRYHGIYAFLNKAFVENYLSDTIIINREEDLGLAGLRKAKTAYDPLRKIKKFIVDF